MFGFISAKLFIIACFFVCYSLIAIFHRKINPVYIIFAGVVVLFASGAVGIKDAFSYIDFNVLGIFWGVMVLSELFILSRVPAYLATRMVSKTSTVCMAILAVSILSGFISSFSENVATVLIVAPIAFEIARRLQTSPVPFLIGIAVSSNLQGSATLIGDPPSIIMASFAKMNFMDFFWFQGKPGIAFAVEIAAVFSVIVLYFLFRKYNQKVYYNELEKVKTWSPAILMASMVACLIAASFIPQRPHYTLAFICIVFGICGLLWYECSSLLGFPLMDVKNKRSLSIIKDLDWSTMFFLTGVFIFVGALGASGFINDVANFIINATKNRPFLAYSMIVWISVLISSFVDNVPYTVAMLPVAKLVSESLGMPMYPFIFGLVIGTTVGGNITPIGAAANIVAVGKLRKEGYKVGFMDFIRIGLPFTLVAVLAGYLFIWWVWK